MFCLIFGYFTLLKKEKLGFTKKGKNMFLLKKEKNPKFFR